MSETNPVSDQKTSSSADDQNPENPNPESVEPKGDTVKYETYKRTVGEVKKFKSKLTAAEEELQKYKEAERKREEEEMEKRGEFDKVKKNLMDELEKERLEKKALLKQQTDNRKLGAFLSTLGGSVDKEYWPLIDIDQIAIDPDSGEIDELSVTRLADSFKSKHSRLIDGVKGPKVYDGSPNREASLSVEEWRKLPLKERKERMGEVYSQATQT